MSKINVLVVDDSAFMRKFVSDIINLEHDMTVVGTARDGLEAIERAKELKPDVITMDVEMPHMTGSDALKEIMKSSPTKILMVSTHTKKGADITIECLSNGAFDFLEKPTASNEYSLSTLKEQLVVRIRASRQVDLRSLLIKKTFPVVKVVKETKETPEVQKTPVARVKPTLATKTPVPTPARPNMPAKKEPSRVSSSNKILLIASSTGGPRSLEKVIEPLPEKIGCPGIIVQHMPPGFTKSLAERLDKSSSIRVKEAEDGETLEKDVIYIAPGNFHLGLKKHGAEIRLFLDSSEKINNVRPSADFTFDLAAELYGGNIVCTILTGMGKDGSESAERIKALGGKVIAESKETSVVYGMPKAIVDKGIADFVSPNTEIAQKIISFL